MAIFKAQIMISYMHLQPKIMSSCRSQVVEIVGLVVGYVLLSEDKSMTAMVNNDAQKEWMTPMLSLRNDLDYRTEEKGYLREKDEILEG